MYYKVTWEIEIDAENPREAAEEVRRIQLDPYSEALFFDTEDSNGNCVGVELPLPTITFNE